VDSYFAVTAPGLEVFTEQELRLLFPLPAGGHAGMSAPVVLPAIPGGVPFVGQLTNMYAANLHLRTATRILARLGNFFRATTFPELELRLSHLPWERHLVPGQPVSLRVTCHKSKLYHSGAVARSVTSAINRRMGQVSPIIKGDEESDQPGQLVVVRMADDICTVSVDSSGDLLHKRGYRQAVAKAPLRETLAAAMLIASGWDRQSPLLDPFCGSGTIPIEAALLARGVPPGFNRHFAFMDWPGYEPAQFNALLAGVAVKPAEPLILASDRDAGAVRMAIENATRAGVVDFIEFKRQAVSSITPPAQPGWVVTNPPYGIRLSEGNDLRNLYARFGNILRDQCPGWQLALLYSDPILLGQLHMKLDTSMSMVNGGLRVRLARGAVGAPIPSPA
jgi:putative N6-adenine-specific DNA methylase